MFVPSVFGQSSDYLNYIKINAQLDKIYNDLEKGNVSRKKTNDYLMQINELTKAINSSRLRSNDNLENINKKITALGEAPEEESSLEPENIAKQRKEFNQKADFYRFQIAQADLVKTRIDDINILILNARNKALLNSILVKQSSIFQLKELGESLWSFAGFVFELSKSPFIWYQKLSVDDKVNANKQLSFVFLTLALSFIAAFFLRKYIKLFFGYKESIVKPNYTQRLHAALWMFAARGVIPAAIFGAFMFWLQNNPLFYHGPFGYLLYNAALYLLYFFITRAFILVCFTPCNPKWKLIKVDSDRTVSISRTLVFSAAAIFTVIFFQTLADKMKYDNNIIYALNIFANGVKALCIIQVAKKFLYEEDNSVECNLEDSDDPQELSTSSKISLGISFFMIIAFGISLFGYIKLSEFIINKIIFSAIVIGVFYIVDNLLKVLFHQLLSLKFWVSTFRIRKKSLLKAEFWFALIIKPIFILFAAMVLLGIWGVSVDIMFNMLREFFVGFNIGNIHISITSILLGILSFFVSVFLFKMLRNSLQSGNLSQIEMDEGIRNSLISGIGFLGFIFSVVLAIAVMGGSFKSIAIMAGALSFGAGLGLQTIVSNLVAGITILFERPIKVGDWVIINDQEGIVKQINMRATILEKWNKSIVIIPNSDIISTSLINKTHSNKMSRVEIKLGVDYNSDLDLVKKTLLEIAAGDEDVLKNPEPSLAFIDLADNSLNFQLNCYISNVYNTVAVANRIRENIIRVFREKNINIPFPQRVMHVINHTDGDGNSDKGINQAFDD